MFIYLHFESNLTQDRQECLSYQSKTRRLTLGHGSGSLKVPVVSFLLLWAIFQLSPHNQRAALVPMMVGMMVCAMMVVCAAEAHKVIRALEREQFLYLTVSPDVNENSVHLINKRRTPCRTERGSAGC
ncbi:MAG TPA: hypothetical protein VGJ66_23005 [Pyrinomonadaceae bacterium]|jgi:hypothetical protein